jgi:two-component system catabolic regulation response regulator CreB/two-component system response regulator ChvI
MTKIKKNKILVVDYEHDSNLLLKTILERNGFIVDCFDDPFVAMENFRSNLFSLIILNIKLPKLNGFQLYREIRKKDKKVKVCFITDGEMYYGVYTDIFNSLDENSFIRKPINYDNLLEHLSKIIICAN